jgi:hypothetical protein
MHLFAVNLAAERAGEPTGLRWEFADKGEVNTVKITHAGEQLPAVSITKAG